VARCSSVKAVRCPFPDTVSGYRLERWRISR
jgi:hypothetical protein